MTGVESPPQQPVPAKSGSQPQAPRRKKRRGCCCCCLVLVLLPVLLAVGFSAFAYFYMGRAHPVEREWREIPEYFSQRASDGREGSMR